MKKLNDYLYSGDTVLKILQRYSEDLKQSSKETHNQIDLVH
ncbi:MAG: guanosine polyphosphate pyrophosphohydrolase, partial [Lacrimispora sp.]